MLPACPGSEWFPIHPSRVAYCVGSNHAESIGTLASVKAVLFVESIMTFAQAHQLIDPVVGIIMGCSQKLSDQTEANFDK